MPFLSEPVATYPSLSEFYAGNPRRRPSPEVDVGLWWRDDGGTAVARAAWVRETGELIVVHYGIAEDGGGSVEVLAVIPGRDDVGFVTGGWEDVCGEVDSLRWLRIRAACWPYAWAE
jgi:hypothetical protein